MLNVIKSAMRKADSGTPSKPLSERLEEARCAIDTAREAYSAACLAAEVEPRAETLEKREAARVAMRDAEAALSDLQAADNAAKAREALAQNKAAAAEIERRKKLLPALAAKRLAAAKEAENAIADLAAAIELVNSLGDEMFRVAVSTDTPSGRITASRLSENVVACDLMREFQKARINLGPRYPWYVFDLPSFSARVAEVNTDILGRNQ